MEIIDTVAASTDAATTNINKRMPGVAGCSNVVNCEHDLLFFINFLPFIITHYPANDIVMAEERNTAAAQNSI